MAVSHWSSSNPRTFVLNMGFCSCQWTMLISLPFDRASKMHAWRVPIGGSHILDSPRSRLRHIEAMNRARDQRIKAKAYPELEDAHASTEMAGIRQE